MEPNQSGQRSPLSSAEAKAKQLAFLRLKAAERSLNHARKHKRAAVNPRPQQTTQYRVQKVAAESLVVKSGADFEIDIRTRHLAEQDKYTTSEYWRDH
jgi:hypothetical protein